MYKQKQLLWRSSKRRGICNLVEDKNRKKKRQIFETYIISPQKRRSNSVFQIIQKNKLSSFRNKQLDRYILINPRSKYSRKVQTQLSDHEDEYFQELRSLKTQIKDIQKDMGDKKIKQKQEQYMQEMKNIKSEIINLKNNQKDVDDKKILEEYFVDDISNMREEIKQLQELVLQKRSSHHLPLIHNRNFIKVNPQNFSVPIKQALRRRYNKNIRSDSVYIESQNQLKQLREELRQLRSDIVSKKEPYPNYSVNPPSMRGSKYSHVQFSKSQLKDQSNLKLESIYVANPRANKHQRSNSYVSQRIWLKKVQQQALKKFKRAVNAILFTHRLQRFSERIRLKRQNFVKQSFKDNIYSRVKIVKDIYLKSTLQFINTLPTTEQGSLVIVSSDTEVQRANKVGWTRKYLNKFFDLIKETQFMPTAMQSLTEICYFVCRHGSAGVLSNYFTAEQLDIMCVSKASLKVVADKNLEKSQIISFIWVKLIVFNILFRTDTNKELKLQNNPVWNANFSLFGSLIYEICRKIQAQLIEKAPINYVIGNWKHLNFINTKNCLSRKTINPSKSMIIDLKQYEKTFPSEDIPTQLVQGTVSRKFLLEAYGYENWQPEEKRIFNYVQLIHRRICKYHAQLKDQLL